MYGFAQSVTLNHSDLRLAVKSNVFPITGNGLGRAPPFCFPRDLARTNVKTAAESSSKADEKW